MKINLAWSMLTNDKTRMALAVCGVGFAVLLMFVEIGFLNGVYDSQTMLLTKFNADLIMINRIKNGAYELKPFPRRRLEQTLQHKDVQAAYPVYMHLLKCSNMNEKQMRDIMVIGFDVSDPVFVIPEIKNQAKKLKVQDTVLVDSTSRLFCYGNLAVGSRIELNRQRFNIIGHFTLFPNFIADGHMVTSDVNLLSVYTDPASRQKAKSDIEFGLIKIAPGANTKRVLKDLRGSLPKDVLILSVPEAVEHVKAIWRESQPVVVVFGLGITIGFVIGCIICYQILFTDIEEHSAEFATLKAIGYTNRHLMSVVCQEGLYLALLAFVPGFLSSLFFYSILQALTGILMKFTLHRVLTVLVLTVIMCLLSAAIAIRRVIKSDPAEVF